ncbi:hypothetical protein D6D01_06777 [Aureobasidium pullulans]|uniref:Uncharacterized protein n=1 Tax=Aureobasidium pullulans TaxID=5580 RepID=A0A4V6TEP5_AURPU|nr:hypothetical protein D6D01_06777 [Aureobasidium pullulans]
MPRTAPMAENLQNIAGHDTKLLDSVVGSVTACANVSKRLRDFTQTSAGCLSSPLDLLVVEFSLMSEAYRTSSKYLKQKSVVSPNATPLLKFIQNGCHRVAAELPKIIDKIGEWNIMAPECSCDRLDLLSGHLEEYKAHLNLLNGILDLSEHLPQKPAPHESPESVLIPPRPRYMYTMEHITYTAALKRQKAAREAQVMMDSWSAKCVALFASIRDVLQWKRARLEELATPKTSHGLLRKSVLEATCRRLVTQSTMGIMTPTEDWSDIGSDTTEISRPLFITRYSLQRCAYATASFARLVERLRLHPGPDLTTDVQRMYKSYDALLVHLLHTLDTSTSSQSAEAFLERVKTVAFLDLYRCRQAAGSFLNGLNDVEQSFGQAPSSTPVSTDGFCFLHRELNCLAGCLKQNIGAPMPVPGQRPVPVPDPVLTPDVREPFILETHSLHTHVDKLLNTLVDSMESTPTDKDIMKLVFHWTTLDECDGFKREDVMRM